MMGRTKRPQETGPLVLRLVMFPVQTSPVSGRQRIYRKLVANIKEQIAVSYTTYGLYFLEGNLAIRAKALTMSVFFDQAI